MKILGDKRSGNCYKIELTCQLMGIAYEFVHIDIMRGEARTPEFLALNPNGKIPVVELDDGRCLWESNAIINFLAAGSDLVPADVFLQAQVQQWQFFEQYSHEPYIAVRRFIKKYLGLPEERRKEFESKKAGCENALAVMENQLSKTPFLVGSSISTADIALFAYTHLAHEADIDLCAYLAVTAWLSAVESVPGFHPMDNE